MHKLRENGDQITEDEITEMLAGVVGWPGFKDVFTVSAREDEGIDFVREYILNLAKKRPWSFSYKLKSRDDPRITGKLQ